MNTLWEDAVQQMSMDGQTFKEEEDGDRLRKQLTAVKSLMLDGKWRTLTEISLAVGAPEASVSARLRDLRKPRFGSYKVERQHMSRGLWKYRVEKSPSEPQE